jgi:DNA recombination protein RmuC
MLAAGALAGAVAAWLYFRSECAVLGERLQAHQRQIEELEVQLRESRSWTGALEKEGARLKVIETELKTTLEQEKKAAQEKLAVLEEARQRLADAFKALCADALRSNNEAFLQLAREALEKHQTTAQTDLEVRQRAIAELVKPVADSLIEVNRQLQELENKRSAAYAGLAEQVARMTQDQARLQSETSKLVAALRSPAARGLWGEMLLDRVLEIAGMIEGVHYARQSSIPGENGRFRPDVVLNLPNRKHVIVDAKAPLQAYLESLDAPDDRTRFEKLKEHAFQIRSHIQQLSAKAYWDKLEASPEFVVMFLPGEVFFSAALEQDAGLIEYGAEKHVLVATPTTLIALLRAVSYGWKQEQVAESARAVSSVGRELYERVNRFARHFVELRRGLLAAVESYNQAAGSLESRVLVTARKFKDLGAASDAELPKPDAIDEAVRLLHAVELEEEPVTHA